MKSLNLSSWSLNSQPLVRFLIIVFFLAGFWAYSQLSQKEDPDFPFNTMVIGVGWPGATAQEVKQQILERIEKHLQDVPYLDEIESYARPGKAVIYIQLAEGVDTEKMKDAWYQVRKKVSDLRHELPSDIIGPFFNDEFGDVYGSMYALTTDGFSYAQLKSYSDSIRLDLLTLPSVAKVKVIGLQPQKIFIEFSHVKIATLGIDPQLIIDTVRDQNDLQSAGVVRTSMNEIVLRPTGNFDSLKSIRNANIHTSSGDFRLGDIAKIYRGYEDPPDFKMHYQGKEAIGLAIAMVGTGNIIALGKDLELAMKRIQADLPVGIEIYQISDQPQVVKHAVNGFMRSLLEAIVIIMAISFLSLGLRAGFVVALSIPLVLVITFLVMMFCNLDVQRVSLGAMIIAMGLLVDDAMIAVEMMLRKLNEGLDKYAAATYAYTSTAFPMLSGTLITIAGFMPIGLAKSDAGQYTFSLFSVITISLLISWVVSVIFAPYFGYHILKKPAVVHDTSHGRVAVFVRNLVTACLARHKLVVALTLAAFIVSIFGFRFVEQQFFPFSDRPEVIVNMHLPEGTPYMATEKEVRRLEKMLNGDKNIKYYLSYIGGNTPRFYLLLHLEEDSTNEAQLVIMTQGDEARDEVVEKIRNLLAEHFPNVLGQVSLLQNGPPVSYPIQFRVSGRNPDKVSEIADKVAAVVRQNPHASDVHKDWQKIFKQSLVIDSDKSRALGISGAKFAANLEAVIKGIAITQYREGNELIDVEVRGRPSDRSNVSSLKDINLYTSNGHFVPLDQVARLAIGQEEGIIRLRDGLPTVTVQADVVGSVQALDVAHSIEKALGTLKASLPPGYKITIAGVAESSTTAVDSIMAVLPIAVAIMALILMLQLHSFQRVLLVFITAPLGLIGVSLVLLIFRLPFGFVAMLGVISLAGMIMRNSAILIDQTEKYIESQIAPREAIILASVERFRPIMLTAAAAILAMIPLLESVFWRPMAAAIMGGLFVATILTIVFLPALYAWWRRV